MKTFLPKVDHSTTGLGGSCTGKPQVGGSYGSYSTCSNCGVSGQRSSWNSLDSCSSEASCCQTSPPMGGNFTPDNRCDFRERNSRNRYDWKAAFDFGTCQSVPTCHGGAPSGGTTGTLAAPGMNYGKNGAGCMFMGSMMPTDASFPWGYELGASYNPRLGWRSKDASYGGYVGDLDKDRQNTHGAKFVSDGTSMTADQPVPPFSCDGFFCQENKPCRPGRGTSPVRLAQEHCLMGVPFQNYEQF